MDSTTRNNKCNELKLIKREIRQQLKINEENELEYMLKTLENTKNDSIRYYKVMREIQYKRPKPLQIKDEKKQMADTEEKQVELITKYFKKMFAGDNYNDEIKDYPPTEMFIPFTGEEVQTAAKNLKMEKVLE